MEGEVKGSFFWDAPSVVGVSRRRFGEFRGENEEGAFDVLSCGEVTKDASERTDGLR